MSDIADYIDERKQEYDDQQAILSLDEQMLDAPESIVIPGRSLIREDDLLLDSEVLHAFLFTDAVLIAKKHEIHSKKEGKSTFLLLLYIAVFPSSPFLSNLVVLCCSLTFQPIHSLFTTRTHARKRET